MYICTHTYVCMYMSMCLPVCLPPCAIKAIVASVGTFPKSAQGLSPSPGSAARLAPFNRLPWGAGRREGDGALVIP